MESSRRLFVCQCGELAARQAPAARFHLMLLLADICLDRERHASKRHGSLSRKGKRQVSAAKENVGQEERSLLREAPAQAA